jgi:hypothetical protein
VPAELQNIFTFHCVRGNALDLEFLSASQLVRLCAKCGLLDKKRQTPLITKEMINIIYLGEAKGHNGAPGKMNFDGFLNALIEIAKQVDCCTVLLRMQPLTV